MNYLFYSVAVYLLNSVLLAERGPFGSVEKLRASLKDSHSEVKMAMGCPFCLSAYTSMMVVALGVLLAGDSPRKAPLNWLITWGLTWLLYETKQFPSEVYVMALEIKKQPQIVVQKQQEITVK